MAAPFIFAALIALINFVLFPRRLKSLYNADKALQEPCELTLTPEGITEKNARGSAQFFKDEFRKVIFGKKVLSIFVSLQKAILIPRHCFSSKEEEGDFEAFVKENYVTEKKK